MRAKTTPATLIGVPLDLGANNLGVNTGPDAFRHQDIVGKLTGAGLKVTDTGNLKITDRSSLKPGNPHLHYADEIVRVTGELAQGVEDVVRSGHKAIVVGGDHSLTLGTVAGASAAVGGELGVIYLDAHGDMNTESTTLSGNIHGMHLASLMGFGAAELAHVHGSQIKLKPANLLHIGGSDWDEAELKLIKRENITAFTLFDLLTQGLGPLITLIDELAARVPHIWISLDLDSIDRLYAPGAGMPNAKGLTYREVATLAEYVGTHAHVVGIDVVEYNPLIDEGSKTAELGIELIAKFLGHNYSWYTGYMAQNQL